MAEEFLFDSFESADPWCSLGIMAYLRILLKGRLLDDYQYIPEAWSSTREVLRCSLHYYYCGLANRKSCS